MRYKFYRVHKYVSAAMNDVERVIAKTDFREDVEIARAKKEWQSVSDMLKAHAEYEENSIHPMLEAKGSKVHTHAHDQHEEMDAAFPIIDELFDRVEKESDLEERVEIGFQLYLTYRKFVGDNLLHLHEEEVEILPELQRLYSDEEMRALGDKAYSVMTPEQMVDMLRVLFPHMNTLDKDAFLEEMKILQPEKFSQVEEQLMELASQD